MRPHKDQLNEKNRGGRNPRIRTKEEMESGSKGDLDYGPLPETATGRWGVEGMEHI